MSYGKDDFLDSVQKDKIYQCDKLTIVKILTVQCRDCTVIYRRNMECQRFDLFPSALFSQRHRIYDERKSRTWRLKLYNRALQSLLFR